MAIRFIPEDIKKKDQAAPKFNHNPLLYIGIIVGGGSMLIILFPWFEFNAIAPMIARAHISQTIYPSEPIVDRQNFVLNRNIPIGGELLINVTKYKPFPSDFKYTKNWLNETYSPIPHRFEMEIGVTNNLNVPVELNATQFIVESSFSQSYPVEHPIKLIVPVEQPVKLINPNRGQQDRIEIDPYDKVPIILTTNVYGVRDLTLAIKLEGFTAIIALPTPY